MNAPYSTLVPAGQIQLASPEVLGRIERRWEMLPERLEAKLLALRSIDRRPEERCVGQAEGIDTTLQRWHCKATRRKVMLAGDNDRFEGEF